VQSDAAAVLATVHGDDDFSRAGGHVRRSVEDQEIGADMRKGYEMTVRNEVKANVGGVACWVSWSHD
jgi:hypothetical protein